MFTVPYLCETMLQTKRLNKRSPFCSAMCKTWQPQQQNPKTWQISSAAPIFSKVINCFHKKNVPFPWKLSQRNSCEFLLTIEPQCKVAWAFFGGFGNERGLHGAALVASWRDAVFVDVRRPGHVVQAEAVLISWKKNHLFVSHMKLGCLRWVGKEPSSD